MKRPFYFAIVVIATTTGLPSCGARAEVLDAGISASWKLVGNRPDGRFQAQLSLHNDEHSALTGKWELYFNSSAKLLPDSISPDYELTHVNGDLYIIRPTAGAKPVEPGESREIALEGAPWAINVSDAPSGFYIIRAENSNPPSRPKPVSLKIESFPAAERLRRGGEDLVIVATADSRFAENEAVRKLPADQLIKIVPTPLEIQPLQGYFRLDASIKIINDPALANEANILADALAEVLKGDVVVEQRSDARQSPSSTIRLRIADIQVVGSTKRKGEEAYQLTVTSDNGVEIVGSDPAGVFYGVQTLRALLPIEAYRQRNDRLKIAAVRVADGPRFRYRGLHLDVARNFQSKQTVKKLLNLIAFYKLNRFHLHLTDDEGWRIEIKKLPELAMVGGRRGHTLDETDCLVPSHGSGPISDPALSPGSGFYTQDDFIEILRYAQARHIAVIPEFDFPGHARAAIKSMEARHRRLLQQDPVAANEFLLREPGDESKYESVQMWHDNVVDVGRDATYHFLSVVFGELADIYRRAGVPLTSIHLGGDEVPTGAWDKSPACKRIVTDANSEIPRRGQLELYFLDRASELLAKRSVQAACWEDCLLLETGQDAAAGRSRQNAGRPRPTAYVWNNVWGWGREDAAYRLANAGFDVVLCNATHLYFDLACEKNPLERGYYWAGFVGIRAPFEFVPLDVFKNAGQNAMGQPLRSDSFTDRARLTPDGARHILGIQGQLWGENLRSPRDLEYMAFPRVIVLAERAWARSPDWADIGDASARRLRLDEDWNQFANRLGQRELPRLDFLSGGVHYRLPPPGAVMRNGQVHANSAFPGLTVRYTIDGSEPDEASPMYTEPVPITRELKLRSFDSRGRGSFTVDVVDQVHVQTN